MVMNNQYAAQKGTYDGSLSWLEPTEIYRNIQKYIKNIKQYIYIQKYTEIYRNIQKYTEIYRNPAAERPTTLP